MRARQSKGVGWKDEAASASKSLARENAAVAARRETEEEVEARILTYYQSFLGRGDTQSVLLENLRNG